MDREQLFLQIDRFDKPWRWRDDPIDTDVLPAYFCWTVDSEKATIDVAVRLPAPAQEEIELISAAVAGIADLWMQLLEDLDARVYDEGD